MSIYFILVGRYFKIGFSDNAQRRFERLHLSGTRYTFPADASIAVDDRTLVRVIPGEKSDETKIQLALDDFTVGLEWFLNERPLRDFIMALPTNKQPRPDYPKLERVGGWCEQEFFAVQQGRAQREIARHQLRHVRAAS